MRLTQKSFRQKIVITTSFLLFLFSMTLLINRVGINSNQNQLENDGLCGIEINKWFAIYTAAVACKLLLTIARYYFFKRNRKENLPLFFLDLIGMNVLMTGIFIQANLLYYSERNLCWQTNDQLTKSFYIVFCILTTLGYL